MPANGTSALDRFRAHLSVRTPPHVVAVFMFGSHAEGREHNESDVDLGVLFEFDQLPSRRERFNSALSLASELQAAVPQMQIDLLVLNDAPPALAARVVVEGVSVYVANREAEHAFRRDAQLRAADVAPFIARAARVKLESMAR